MQKVHSAADGRLLDKTSVDVAHARNGLIALSVLPLIYSCNYNCVRSSTQMELHMTPYHRNVLLELAYNLDHVLWSYGAEIEADPRSCLSAQDLTLSDFCRRSLSLVHTLVNDDSARRGPSLRFIPPSPDEMRLLRRAFDQRKKRDAQQAESNVKTKPAPSPSQPVVDDGEADDSLIEPDPHDDDWSQKEQPRPARRSGVRQ